MLTIRPISDTNSAQYNAIDNRYLVSEMTVLKINRTGFSLEYTPLPKSEWKSYPPDDRFTASELIKREDANCFFAYENGTLTGQAVIIENWNNLALLWDLRVDSHYRRKGIGRELITACCDWAKKKNLKGLMLETQDTNPSACQFYESYGFVLGGIDRMLYSAIPEQAAKPAAFRDSALFFYYVF